jgi:hypothetical protein
MRAYWQAAAGARSTLIPGTAEHDFAIMADEICREYEAVLASVRRASTAKTEPRQRSISEWDQIDQGILEPEG